MMKHLRIFIAFASDCAAERRIIRKICTSNPSIKKLCLERDISLDCVDFSEVTSDAGRPQSLINAAAGRWQPDWFIFLFWRRLGSDAGLGLTGMEEEWNRAIDLHRRGNGHPRVSLYFNKAEGDAYDADPAQIEALARFKKNIFENHQALATSFHGPREFRDQFHADLTYRLIEVDRGIGSVDLDQEFRVSSNGLLLWPRTLGANNEIQRPELQTLLETIRAAETSTTLVLGEPGSGKSSLLAGLGHECLKAGFSVLGIKADMLGKDIHTPDDLRRWLNLTLNAGDAVKKVALSKPVVVLVDQLDAVSELVDKRSDRLNVLLNLIHSLSGCQSVHIIATSRLFEYRHDIRLNSLNADRLDLVLPPWEKIAPVVANASHDPTTLTDLTKELLRSPWCLKLFLEIAKPDKSFSTFQSLLEEVWNQRVLTDKGGKDRVELLEHLAKKMSTDETFWLPSSIADRWQDDLLGLEREDILRRGPDGSTIGFRHQTFYDYTLARTFAKGTLSLSQHVKKRQDGLFVRPTLLSGIHYLRATSKTEYHRQIRTLFQQGFRPHIRSLLIEFLGTQQEPDDVELSLACVLLKMETTAPRVLASIAGSPGWFKRMSHLPAFLKWMQKPHDKAIHCLNSLCLATQFDGARVVDLLQKYWLPRTTYDDLSLRVLSYFTKWTPRAVDIACPILRRKVDHNASLLVDNAAKTSAELAIILLEAALVGHLRRALAVIQKLQRKKPLSREERLTTNPSLEGVKSGLIKLIEKEEDWYNLDVLAESAPKPFLDRILPWFVKVISKFAYKEHPFLNRYRDDPATYKEFGGELPHGPIVNALLVAVTQLAQQAADQFLEVASLYSSSDLLIVHRLLARGFLALSSHKPGAALGYLLGDPRRLEIGDFADRHRESKALIETLSSSLNEDDMKCLEAAVVAFQQYKKILPKWTAKERFDRTIWTREHRLRLLRAFRPERMTETVKALREQEERALLNVSDFDSRLGGGWVGPRITATEMGEASNSDLLNLFKELPDGTEGMNPKRQWFGDSSRAGGARQLARELEGFSKAEPQRALSLLDSFNPGEQETYAAGALEGLATTDVSTSELIARIQKLIDKGFTSGSFREGTARTLKIRASKEQGLPQTALTMLEAMLNVHLEPDLAQYKEGAQKDDVEHGREILFGHGSTWVSPHGRGPIIEALADGYLRQDPPNYLGWANLITSRLKAEKHPAIWVVTLMRMPPLFNWHRAKATALFNAVICEHPSVLNYGFALHAIARMVRCSEPKTSVQTWLEYLQARRSDFAQQAYGELLFLYHCCYHDSWSTRHIARLLRSKRTVRAVLGLTHGASHLWKEPHCRSHSTQVLESVARQKHPLLVHAMCNVFRLAREEFVLGSSTYRLVRAISRNRKAVLDSAEDLCELLSHMTIEEPQLVLQVCQSALRVGRAQIQRQNWSSVPEHLTSIALTLHRQKKYRKAGLELFESLLKMNLAATKEALDVLDRPPVSRALPYRPKRTRRRRVVASGA